MAVELGRSSPQEQRQTLPAEVLRPQIDALIESFRDKLSQSTEFKDALVNNYVYGEHGEQDNLETVEFQKGNHQYSVYLNNIPELTDEEFEGFKGTGPSSPGGTTLRIERSPSAEFEQELDYDECLELHIVRESSYGYTGASYENYEEDIDEINTRQALEKAREIIDSF